MPSDAPQAPPLPIPADRGPIRAVWRADGWPVAAAAAATLAVVLGVYALARGAGAIPSRALVACLAAGTLWMALVCGALAAGGRDGISAVLRGGVVADAGGVGLLVLWGFTAAPRVGLSFVTALKIYCTWVSVALVGVAAARVARRPAGRWAGAVAVAVLISAALASPFWLSGPASQMARDDRGRFLAVCVEANPFYSVTTAITAKAGTAARGGGFVWHQSGAMYEMSSLSDYGCPPVAWYAATLWYLPLAALLVAVHLVRWGWGKWFAARTPGRV